MNKKVLYSLVVIIILLGIAGAIFLYRGAKLVSSLQPGSSGATVDQNIPAGFNVFANEYYGFRIAFPPTLDATTTFAASYLVGSGWNLYNDPTKDTGVPVISLRKIGSNDITDAELRIGVGTSAADVSTCTTTDPSVKAAPVTVNGTVFTTFTESDAATMHYSTATSFRTVHNGICYAIDEFVTGTNPEVYSPPRTAPFTQDEAFQEMNKALGTFVFTK